MRTFGNNITNASHDEAPPIIQTVSVVAKPADGNASATRTVGDGLDIHDPRAIVSVVLCKPLLLFCDRKHVSPLYRQRVHC